MRTAEEPDAGARSSGPLQGILARITKASWYKQGGTIYPLFISLAYLSYYEEPGLGDAIVVQDGDANEGYFDKEKELSCGRQHLAAFLEDERYLEKRIALWRVKTGVQLALIQEAVTTADEDFPGLMQRYCPAAKDAWRTSFVIEEFDPWGDQVLREYTAATSLGDSDIAILTAPHRLPFVQQERLEWLAAVESGDREAVARHAERYFWIETSWQHSQALDEGFFLKRLEADRERVPALREEARVLRERHEALQHARAALLAEKPLDVETRLVMEFFAQLNDWRDERKKEQTCKTNYAIMRLAEQIASRNGIPVGLMRHAMLSEISSRRLSAAYTNVLRRRAQEPYVMWRNPAGLLEWFEGTDARHVIKRLEEALEASSAELTGRPAYPGVRRGTVRVVNSVADIDKMQDGDIVVSVMTRPELTPALKRAGAIVTDEGGITCHAAVVSRELKVPCVVGTQTATRILHDGDLVEVNADKGIVQKTPSS